jgi:uncharacterized sulfatase
VVLFSRSALSFWTTTGSLDPPYRCRTIVEDHTELTIYARMEGGILCNLRDDPYETRNLWADPAYAEIKARLTAHLLEELVWSDPLGGPRISGS